MLTPTLLASVRLNALRIQPPLNAQESWLNDDKCAGTLRKAAPGYNLELGVGSAAACAVGTHFKFGLVNAKALNALIAQSDEKRTDSDQQMEEPTLSETEPDGPNCRPRPR